MGLVARYPFERWARVRRADLGPIRTASRWLGEANVAAEALGRALGTPVRLCALRVDAAETERLAGRPAPFVGVVLEDSSATTRCILELEAGLAHVVVDRLLGGTGNIEVATNRSAPGELERGLIAYAVARTLREAGAALFVADVSTDASHCAATLGGAQACLLSARCELGESVGAIRAWLQGESCTGSRDVGAPNHASIISELELTLVACGGRATLVGTELESLALGDVVVLDEASVRREALGVAGEVTLAVVGGARCAWRASLCAGNITILATSRTSSIVLTEGRVMKEESTRDIGVALAGDAPIELVVELARFRVPLEELAAMRPGEVLATGAHIGERVILRAADRAIAEGELVDVEGEVGVRILSLAR